MRKKYLDCIIAFIVLTTTGCAMLGTRGGDVANHPSTVDEIDAYFRSLNNGVPLARIIDDLNITVLPTRTYAPAYREKGWRFVYETDRYYIEFRAVGKDVRGFSDFVYVGDHLVLTHEQAAQQLHELEQAGRVDDDGDSP